MVALREDFIANQVFLGLPWATVRPKYERAISKLSKKYPLHFTIVGRDGLHTAEQLFEVIKKRIVESSAAIFDATGGNANVSLEYGYAEGREVPRTIFLSDHKAANKNKSGSPIISDLIGHRRIHYKNEKKLLSELEKYCRTHAYVERFEKALKSVLKNRNKGAKKSGRSLALKVIHQLDGKQKVRRNDVIQNLQAEGYKEIEVMLKALHKKKIVYCSVGKYSEIQVK